MSTAVQLEFARADAGRSQNHRLRDYLTLNPRQWIPMPELAKVITATGIGAAVHSRVNDCRKKFGMHIERKLAKGQDGQCLPSYFYDPDLPSNFGCQRNTTHEA